MDRKFTGQQLYQPFKSYMYAMSEAETECLSRREVMKVKGAGFYRTADRYDDGHRAPLSQVFAEKVQDFCRGKGVECLSETSELLDSESVDPYHKTVMLQTMCGRKDL